MENLRKSNKPFFLLSTDIASDNLDDEVHDICDTLNKETVSKDRQHKLSVVLPPTRSRSPVTVQEWVASLPDHAEEEEEDDYSTDETDDEQERDTLTLGAEAGYIQPQNAAKLLLASRYKAKQTNSVGGATSDKRGLFQHSDTAASLRSNFSVLSSSSSVSSVLLSREADPGEVLRNLGFGGSETLAKIPARFLKHKSKAKGITVDTFIAKQEDVMTRYESGSYGYRGLHGCSSRRPSDIVEQILHTLKESEKELRRKSSIQSWTSSASFGASAVPSRFRIMDPQRKTFHTIVEQVSQSSQATDHLKTFESVAKAHLEGISENTDKRVTELSDCVSSDVSDNSDWSDEEREKLEKIFGEMSERGEECEKNRHLRRSRRKSRRTQDSFSPCSLGNPGWEIAKIVFSRDSSLSGLTASSLNSSTLELDSSLLDGDQRILDEPNTVNV